MQLVDGFARLFEGDRPVGGVQVVNVDLMGPKIGDGLKRCSAQALRAVSFRCVRRGPVRFVRVSARTGEERAYFVSTTASLRFNLPSHSRVCEQSCIDHQSYIGLTSSAVPLEYPFATSNSLTPRSRATSTNFWHSASSMMRASVLGAPIGQPWRTSKSNIGL